MSLVSPYLKNISRIERELEGVAEKVVLDNADYIKNILKYEQLAKGKNSKGNPLRFSDKDNSGSGYYAPATEIIAKKQGLSVPKTTGSPYNFQWTGDTFDSMGLKKITKGFEIFTIDGKQKKLEEAYGDIFSLTKENNYLINVELIYPKLIEYFLEEFVKI